MLDNNDKRNQNEKPFARRGQQSGQSNDTLLQMGVAFSKPEKIAWCHNRIKHEAGRCDNDTDINQPELMSLVYAWLIVKVVLRLVPKVEILSEPKSP